MPEGVEDRNADLWEALLAVADAAGGDWPNAARVAAVAIVADAKDREPSLGIRLLADLRTVFGEAEAISTEGILLALHSLKEAPWNDLKGKPLNERGLATRLRQYEVKSKVVRIGEATPHGYTREALNDAWERYLPPLPSPAGSATSATSATHSETSNDFNGGPYGDVADVADVADPAEAERPGLSDRAITELAREIEDWAHSQHRHIDAGELEAEIERRLAGNVDPGSICVEVERIMRAIFPVPPKQPMTYATALGPY